LIIGLQYTNVSIVKTRFRWDSFFDPTLEGGTGEFFEKNKNQKKLMKMIRIYPVLW